MLNSASKKKRQVNDIILIESDIYLSSATFCISMTTIRLWYWLMKQISAHK